MKRDRHKNDAGLDENGQEKEVKDTHENGSEESHQKDNQQDLVKEANDKYLRLLADFENFRRRTVQERRDLIQQSNKDLLEAVLPVFDDLERGLASMEKAEDKQAMIDGIRLIFQKFKNVLQQAGVQEIAATGEEFDPELHDAVVMVPAPQPDMKGKVVDEIQRGYKLNDKILRHSKVVVGE
jgi:molecular chaperone GrpE